MTELALGRNLRLGFFVAILSIRGDLTGGGCEPFLLVKMLVVPVVLRFLEKLLLLKDPEVCLFISDLTRLGSLIVGLSN